MHTYPNAMIVDSCGKLIHTERKINIRFEN